MKEQNQVIAVADICIIKSEPRVDSIFLAERLGIQHKNVLSLIDIHSDRFKKLGPLAFKTRKGEPLPQGGFAKSTRYAMLTENQSWLLLTFSKNTERVADLKVKLIQAFSRFRSNAQLENDYQPFYHDLHDTVKTLSACARQHGSETPEAIFHSNLNRLINKCFNVESGQRQALPGHLRARITMANLVARDAIDCAIKSGLDHRQAYERAKAAVTALAAIGTPRLEEA